MRACAAKENKKQKRRNKNEETDRNAFDITAGNMLIVGLGEEDFSSLTKDQLAHYEKLFHQPETFIRLGGHLMAIPIPDKEVRKAEKARKQEAARKSSSHDPR